MSTLLNKKTVRQLILLGIFCFGFSLLAVAAWPFLRTGWDQFWTAQKKQVFPLIAQDFLTKIDNRTKILGDFTNLPAAKEPIILAETPIDYSNLENWFAQKPTIAHQQTTKSYTLEIPKLDIHNAIVRVGGVDIDHNLVQFNTDVEIGEYGAPVIFGHSTLRQLYNPKESNAKRYKSIFSTIMTLEIGDLIIIKQDGITYTYQVVEKKEVPSDDAYILAQNSNLKQLKLVTCTPEGTFIRRGVITAELKL